MRVDDDELNRWCVRMFGSAAAQVLFRGGYLSAVVGLELEDQRQVVVKIRPPADRMSGCFEVHRRLHAAGFPCPEPLVPPTELAGGMATAEAYVRDGLDAPSTGRDPAPFAVALAELIQRAPFPADVPDLSPAPSWTNWDARRRELWPLPEDWEDLNDTPGPAWLDEAAARARARLAQARARVVVGHGDWYVGNLRWRDDDSLLVVHDWDSVIADHESAIVGMAAAVYCNNGRAPEPSLRESAAFIAAYIEASGATWSAADIEEAWAAGVWLRAFDTKKRLLKHGDLRGLDADEAAARLRLAGTA